MIERKSLDKLRYIIILTYEGSDGTFYFADEWPNPEYLKLSKEGYRLSIFDNVYYTSDLAITKIYNDAKLAQRIASDIMLIHENWAAIVKPIAGAEILKAQLKGPKKFIVPEDGDVEQEQNDDFWKVQHCNLLDPATYLVDPMGVKHVFRK